MLLVPFVPLLCFPALGFLFALPAEYNSTTSPPPARSASPTRQVRNTIQAEGNTYILGGIFVCLFLSFFSLNEALKRDSRHQTDMKTSRFSQQVGGRLFAFVGAICLYRRWGNVEIKPKRSVQYARCLCWLVLLCACVRACES